MSTDAKTAAAAREARLAAIRARRASRPTWETLTVKVDQLQPGDFVDRVHSDRWVRGLIFEAPLAAVAERWDRWTESLAGYARGVRSPLRSIELTTRLGTFHVPADMTATIRRPTTPEGA